MKGDGAGERQTNFSVFLASCTPLAAWPASLACSTKTIPEKASVDRLTAAQSYHLAFLLNCYIDIFLWQLWPCNFGIEQNSSLAAINTWNFGKIV